MKKHTVKGTLAAIRAIGCTASHRDGEYRVNLRGSTEATASYTDDAADAIGTAQVMIAAERRKLTGDVVICDQGSIVLVTPLTVEAKAFIDNFVSVPDWAWHGRALAVDHNYADDLLNGMAANGLDVRS